MDETTPLLPSPDESRLEQQDSLSGALADVGIKVDLDDPQKWPAHYRWGVVGLLAFMAFTVTFTCIGLVPIAQDIVVDLEGKRDRSAAVLLVTIWELGEAAGPLFIAPLSEKYGRYPVFNAANVLFIVSLAVAALSEGAGLLIFSRFLTGCAVASNVLNPAIIGDIFPSESRGAAMSAVTLAPLIGGAVGPMIAGAIAQSVGWRKVVWMSLILAVVCELCFLTLLRETYRPAMLRSKVRRLAKTEGPLTESLSDAKGESSELTLWRSLARPAAVLYSSVILQVVSLYGALQFSFYYVLSTTLAVILEERYGFTPALIGTSFMSFSVGSVIGIIVCNTCLDRIYAKLQKPGDDKPHPEDRLPLLMIGAGTLPVVVALYGWVTQLHLPVMLLLAAVALMGFTILLGIVPIMAYVVDAFGLYSASALTAVLMTRCLMGTFLPLATAHLTDAIGYGLGFTILAVVCLVTAPVPLLVMMYGKRWRQRSEYTKDE